MKVQKSIKNYLTVFSFDMICKIVAGVNAMILIRFLSTEEYADYTTFLSLASLISSMIGSGVTTAYLRLSVKNRSKGCKNDGAIFRMSIMMIVVAICVVLPFTPAVRMLYKTKLSIVVLALLEAFVLSITQLIIYLFQARENYKTAGKISNIRNVLVFVGLILLLFLSKLHTRITMVFVVLIAAGLFSLIVASFTIHKLDDFSFSQKGRRNDFVALFFEIKWLILYFSLLAMNNAVDVLMLKRFSNSVQVANYGVAFKYYSLVLAFLPSLMAILRVKTSKSDFEASAEERKKYLQRWIKAFSKFTTIIAVGIVVVAFFMWELINGANYKSAYPCFFVFVIGASISYIFSPAVNFVLTGLHHKKLVLLACIALIVNATLNYIFVATYGAIIVTVTTVVSQAIINVGSTVIIFREK